jgi:hypothetical protein
MSASWSEVRIHRPVDAAVGRAVIPVLAVTARAAADSNTPGRAVRAPG